MEKISQKSYLKLWFFGAALMLLMLCPHSAEAQATNTFPSTGSAGIGTTSPTAPFTISTPGNTLDGSYYTTMTIRKTGDTFSGIRFDKNSTPLFRVGTDSSNNFQIGRFAGAGSPDDGAFYMNQSGNVGIGTTAPTGLLELASTTQANSRLLLSGQEFFAAGNTSTSGIALRLGVNRTGERQIWFADSSQAINATNTQLRMRFFSSSASLDALTTDGNATRPLILQSVGGNVGVGNTSPTYSLDINGGTNAFRTKASTSSANDAIATFESASGIQAIVRANGYIGIGVTSPSQKLQIGSNTPTGTGTPDAISLGATYSSSARSNPKLRLFDDNGASLYGLGVSDHQMDFMIPSNARYVWSVNGVEKMRLDDSGNITVAGNIAAKYQDVAEWVESSQTLAPGTVVVLDETRSNQVIASTQAYDTRVAGVISFQPGITLGEGGENKVLVASTGRVRVKVNATPSPIRIGDLLVTSDVPGLAMKSEPIKVGGRLMHMPGTLIGKALEPLMKGTGEILVLLSLQ